MVVNKLIYKILHFCLSKREHLKMIFLIEIKKC